MLSLDEQGLRVVERLSWEDLRLLPTLQALLLTRSTAAAAKHLPIGQSAVSKQLARLREIFRDPLFVRAPDGLVPTPVAEALAGPIGRILADLDQLIQNPPREVPRFAVAATGACRTIVYPGLNHGLARSAPALQLDLQPAGADALEKLGAGDLDLLIRPETELAAGYRAVRLCEDPWVGVVSRLHARRLSLGDLSTGRLVVVEGDGDPSALLNRALAAHGVNRTAVERVPSSADAAAIVAGSKAVWIAPSELVRLGAGSTDLRVVDLPLALPPLVVTATWAASVHHDLGHARRRRLVVEACRAPLPRPRKDRRKRANRLR